MHLVSFRAQWVDWICRTTYADGTVALPIRLQTSSALPAGLEAHLFTCGIIPEQLSHDSSQEKLYSKYTDEVLALTLCRLGATASVLEARGDSADVQAVVQGEGLVADAKAFRLSRTAKNQKDFKITALAGWRGDHTHALLVAPLYQYPTASSQIYRQAIERGVLLLGYEHLVAVLRLDAHIPGGGLSALTRILGALEPLPATKDASVYWRAVNDALHVQQRDAVALWAGVIAESAEVLRLMKAVEIEHLSGEARRISMMTRDEAIEELLRLRRLEQRIATIGAAGALDYFLR